MSLFPSHSAFYTDPEVTRQHVAEATRLATSVVERDKLRGQLYDLRLQAQRWAEEVSDMAFDLGDDDVEIGAIEQRMRDLVSSMDRVLRSQYEAPADPASGPAGSGEDDVDSDDVPESHVGE